MAAPKILILMADYGHDPTEVTVPATEFGKAGFDVQFATEKGKVPECDRRMLEGVGQMLLGAKRDVVRAYTTLVASEAWQHPLAWSSPNFSIDSYALVFLPGGHEKGMQQLLDSATVHALLAAYFPETRRPGATKAVGAICHGVLALANAKGPDGKSVLSGCSTTTLPNRFEQFAFWSTRWVWGDYYKTYGYGTENLEDSIKKCLDDPESQYKFSIGLCPFVVEDAQYNYISARFPNDAEEMARSMINMVKSFSQ